MDPPPARSRYQRRPNYVLLPKVPQFETAQRGTPGTGFNRTTRVPSVKTATTTMYPNSDTSASRSGCMSKRTSVVLEEEIKLHGFAGVPPEQFFPRLAATARRWWPPCGHPSPWR